MTRLALLLAGAAAAATMGPLPAAAQATHGRPGRPSPPNTALCSLSRSCAPGASVNVIPYVTLHRNSGTLRLDVSPSHADVYVDGVYAGRARDFDGASPHATLSTGAHRIEIRAEGFEDALLVTRINKASRTVHNVTLWPVPRKGIN